MLKRLGYLVLLLCMSVALVACAGKSGGKSDEIELTMWLFSGTGLEEHIEKYQEDNPNIKIKIQDAEYSDHHNNLITALAAGSGAPDIAIVESDYIERFKENSQQFHDLAEYGANDIAGDYLEWRWREATNEEGFVLGIPTDVGPMAMAYRMDIFEQAGLPTDPDEVAQLLSTWDAYIEAGRQLTQATDSHMYNAGPDLFRVIREQAEAQYFDDDGNLILESSEQILKAWDITINNLDVQAGIDRETTEWGAALARGDFATVFLPPWMLQQIKDNAPDTAGLWNVTQIPEASGNWGGSLLTVPAQSDYPQEAYDFISWLLAPEQQLEIFKMHGNFPATPSIYDNEEVQNYSDDFFNRDDLGTMFGEAALRVEYVYRSPMTSTINDILGDAIMSVVDGEAEADEAWNTAVEEVKRQLDRQ